MTDVFDRKLSLSKTLSISCCNGPSCQSIELEFLPKELFIHNLLIKYVETDWKLFAYYTIAIKT